MQVNWGFGVPLFFEVFVIPCVSGGMPVDQLVSHPLRFRADGGTTRNQEPSACLPERHTEIEKEQRCCVSKVCSHNVYQLI